MTDQPTWMRSSTRRLALAELLGFRVEQHRMDVIVVRAQEDELLTACRVWHDDVEGLVLLVIQ